MFPLVVQLVVMTDPGGPAAALQEVAVNMQPLLAGGAAGPGAAHQASWTTEDVKVPQNHHVNLHRVSVSSMSSEEGECACTAQSAN